MNDEGSDGHLDHDGQLTLVAKAVSKKGFEAEKSYGSVQKLVRYLGKNRYGGRDLNVGGDDWVKPSVRDFLMHMAGGHCYGDMSNMNGGAFSPHSTHADGNDVDVKFDSPSTCSSNGSFSNTLASDAQRILDDLNASASRIGTLYVTFSYTATNPVWKTIKGVKLTDGRLACRVIKNIAGHDTHDHWRVDFTDATPGQCPN